MLSKLTEGAGGVGEMLIMADKGGKGCLDPPFLADIICEQPLKQYNTDLPKCWRKPN